MSDDLITIDRDGEAVFILSADGAITCEPENYGLALREICQIFVRATT